MNKQRSLFYKHHLGSVDLSLDFADESRDFLELTPFQATAILALAKQGEYTVQELGEEVGVEKEYLMKKMAFWVNNGVVRFDGERYKIVENAADIGADGFHLLLSAPSSPFFRLLISSSPVAQGRIVVDEMEEAPQSAQEQAEAELLEQVIPRPPPPSSSFYIALTMLHRLSRSCRVCSAFTVP